MRKIKDQVVLWKRADLLHPRSLVFFISNKFEKMFEEDKARKRSDLKHIAKAVEEYRGVRDRIKSIKKREARTTPRQENESKATFISFDEPTRPLSTLMMTDIYDKIAKMVEMQSQSAVNTNEACHEVAAVNESKQATEALPQSQSAGPKTNRPRVYMDISVDGRNRGRIFMELYSDLVPITAENFRVLCSGEKVTKTYDILLSSSF